MEIPSKKIDILARIGFASRAAVYALIGWFGILVPLGMGGRLTDSHIALRELLAKPFGSVFLIVLSLGLFSYAIWRILQAWFDIDDLGSDWKGMIIRIGYVLGGITHGLLGFYAFNLIFHLAKTSEGPGREKQMAGWVLNQHLGQWLLAAIAIGVFIFAIATIYNALNEKFVKVLSIPRRRRQWLLNVCKTGLIARGVVFAVVGWFFLRAALHSSSSEAEGLKGVWKFLGELPFGNLIIGALSIGLIAFSVYGLTEAVYRKKVPATF